MFEVGQRVRVIKADSVFIGATGEIAALDAPATAEEEARLEIFSDEVSFDIVFDEGDGEASAWFHESELELVFGGRP